MITNEQHRRFYEWQIQAQEEAWSAYAETAMNILWQSGRLFAGRIWGNEPNSGALILRFRAGNIPRMKSFYCLCIIGSAAGGSPAGWNFSYTNFRLSQELSGKNTECRTEFFMPSDDPKWRFIGVTGVDLEFLQEVQETFLTRSQHPVIVLAETDPPIEYLRQLRDFVSRNPRNPILNLAHLPRPGRWQPTPIDNGAEVLPLILRHFETTDQLLLQGPPGTGKSFLVAQVCSYYQQQGYAIGVTALTNKALMEVAEKEGLKEALLAGRVFKTNLSSDEQKSIPRLRSTKDITPNRGEVLLSSYYKLSRKLNDPLLQKRFDLLIIEEASQAYLATIAGFLGLAKKVLIVGDHKQLPPVVLNEDQATKEISPEVGAIIKGFETFALHHEACSMRLTKTRRLPQATANLTGIFYDNQLVSISGFDPGAFYAGIYSNLFDPQGGIQIVKLPILEKSLPGQEHIKALLAKIAVDILGADKKSEVALLTPNVKEEKNLYDAYIRYSDRFSRITISTIHKIQGLTTDYTLLYLPLHNPSFDLNSHLFNVATSRARKGALIVTQNSIGMITNRSVEVGRFLENLPDVTGAFMEHLNNIHT
jgi:DNA replication ATP-dependent helicase Dna2